MQKLLKNTKYWKKYSTVALDEIPLSMYFPSTPMGDITEKFYDAPVSKLQTTKLPNGVTVKSSDFNQRGNSVITIQVNAGSRYENYKNSGVSHFAQRFFFDHTNTRTKLRLVTEMEKTGASVSSSNSREHMIYKMETMREAVPKLFELVTDSILGNRLHDCDLPAKTELVERDLEEYAASPEVILNEALHRVAYGEKGLGRNVLCPSHNVHHIHTEEIVSFFEDFYRPERINVIGTNINHDDLVELSNYYLQFDATDKKVEKLKAPYVGGELRLHESNALAYSVLAFKGTCQNDADELYPFTVLANLLGDVDVWQLGLQWYLIIFDPLTFVPD
jgi:predicted Zn-dependent peptidase